MSEDCKSISIVTDFGILRSGFGDVQDDSVMPIDLTRRISELVNKKPYALEDDLQEAIDEMARDIALIEPDPRDWGWWVSYLLEQLDEEAERRGKKDEFARMLKALRQKLGN